MPLISSNYKASGFFKNGHFATIYSAKLRPLPKVNQSRERILLNDGDFLDLDFSAPKKQSSKLAILLHGLEGNAQRTYIKGQAKTLIENGWNVCAPNYRGCSGEPNELYVSYNAGKTDDLDSVISYCVEKDQFSEIALVGFSLGGNLLLKYLGERENLPALITKGVAISTPLDLKGSLHKLSQWNNWVYRTTFLQGLKKKLKIKLAQYPEELPKEILKEIKSLKDFDDVYTAPAHGFEDAYDYYEKNSSLQFLPNINIPVLILNAANDSFLSKNCYPVLFAESSKNHYLETPKYGGHVGFHVTNKTYYSEKRSLEFLNE